MIIDGLKIMILGMATVFIMLGTLVISTIITSRIVAAFDRGKPSSDKGRNDERTVAAVITAALMKFRRRTP